MSKPDECINNIYIFNDAFNRFVSRPIADRPHITRPLIPLCYLCPIFALMFNFGGFEWVLCVGLFVVVVCFVLFLNAFNHFFFKRCVLGKII